LLIPWSSLLRYLIGIREPLAAGFGGVLKITLVSTRNASGLTGQGISPKVLLSMQSGAFRPKRQSRYFDQPSVR
jgi:hypothetical protein